MGLCGCRKLLTILAARQTGGYEEALVSPSPSDLNTSHKAPPLEVPSPFKSTELGIKALPHRPWGILIQTVSEPFLHPPLAVTVGAAGEDRAQGHR